MSVAEPTYLLDDQCAPAVEQVTAHPHQSLRRNVRVSLAEGTAASFMIGAGETYVPAFVLALGMSEIAAGLVVTIPMMAGAFMQLGAPWAIRRLGSRKKWVVACARLQTTSLLLLPLVALLHHRLHWLAFVAAGLYWAGALAAAPAWTNWFETIIPDRIRARFLAERIRFSQMGILTGLMLGAALLNGGLGSGIWCFGILFIVAALSRLASAHLLSSQTEPDITSELDAEPGLAQVIGQLWGTPTIGLLFYLMAVQVSVYTAAPYFTPFMLSELELTYPQFVTLVALGFVGKVLALAAFGKYAERAGARRLLWIGGLGIVPLSAMWALSDSVIYLAAIQVLGGILWAAYELAVFLLFFEAIPSRSRNSLLTIYNLGNSFAMACGCLLGAGFIAYHDLGRSTYLALFVASSVARAATIVLLARVPNTGSVNPRLRTRTIALRPSMATMEQPVLVAGRSDEVAPSTG